MKQKWMFFLESPCFFYNPMNVDNIISCSSVFSKSSLYIWKFSVHILLKSSLKNFEVNLTSIQNVCNCPVVWTWFATALLWDWNQNSPFPVLRPLGSFPNDHWGVFQICLPMECSTFTASSFRTWNSSAGIPSPPLALFVVADRICGCPAAWAFSWGPCAITVDRWP